MTLSGDFDGTLLGSQRALQFSNSQARIFLAAEGWRRVLKSQI